VISSSSSILEEEKEDMCDKYDGLAVAELPKRRADPISDIK
jgi:hypothetical protein